MGTFSKLRLTLRKCRQPPPINNTQPAAGVLAHMMTLTVEAVFVLRIPSSHRGPGGHAAAA